ncbi:MAG: hypothetical protein K2I21_02590, partial [Acetatifactor sp.]|nr:hypothetical protein [Acetatifactor sp.]
MSYELRNKIDTVLVHWGLQGCKTKQIYDTAWQVGDDYVLKEYQDLKMLERNLKMLHLLSERNIPVAQVIPA